MNELQQHFASPEQIFEFVNTVFLKSNVRNVSEQRISERRTAILPIEIQFLDSDLRPIGEPISAVTQDISVGGIGMLSPQPAAGPKAIVRIIKNFDDTPPLLIDLRHAYQVGPFYKMGGCFCADWSAVGLG